MTNAEMLAAILALPDPDLLTETKITDGLGAGSYYSAGTVVRLLREEREKCAKIISDMNVYTGGHGEPCSPSVEAMEDAIRKGE